MTVSKVLVLGGGFGGIAVARELARSLPAEEQCDITLVDRHNYLLFTPLLTEVAGGNIDAEDAAVPIRRISPRVRFMQGSVIHIDLELKQVTVEIGSGSDVPGATRTLTADHLVIALGSETNFHGITELENHALTIKSVTEATAIRSRALALVERAAAEADEQKRKDMLTFVVAGGGFSGVETMAALNDLVHDVAREVREIDPSAIQTLLIFPEGRVLTELDEHLAKSATQELERRGVRIVPKTEVKSATSTSIKVDPPLDGESEVPAHLLVWAAGVKPSPVIESCGAKLGQHHGLVVDSCCRVADHPGVWALGDCAEVPKGSSGTYGPTAQNATREGALVAKNIVATIQGQEPRQFHYQPVGELAIVGKCRGVASLYGVSISGLPAWILWRSVYLGKMPTVMARARVGLKWLVDVLFGRSLVELTADSR